jgi:glycosyltransferase involved in cell wall biosynthesis
MDVLYEVTNLGLAFGTSLTRTGIYRATESFVRAALTHPGLRPRFAALESYIGELQLVRFDESAGGLLGARRVSAWVVDEPALTAAMELVTRLLEIGSTSAEGKRLSAELRLLNRTARARPVAAPIDVYHSLRQALVPRDRLQARARVVTIHDMIPFLFPELTEDRFIEHHRAIIASIDRERDWIICNSACTKADVCGITAMSSDRVFVTPFAAAPDIFHPEPDPERIAPVLAKYGVGTRPYVLSLCTLEPRKNLTRLVRAFFALIEDQRWPDLLLVLVGPTGWKAQGLFASLAERPRERHRVVLTGFVPDEDLSALYSGAQVFVFPSLYEGFGLPVLEAMQCGVPVITSRTSSLLELVGQDAVTVDPTDEDALAQAILDILRDPDRARALGRRGVERASRFTWARTVEETVGAYRTILAASS